MRGALLEEPDGEVEVGVDEVELVAVIGDPCVLLVLLVLLPPEDGTRERETVSVLTSVTVEVEPGAPVAEELGLLLRCGCGLPPVPVPEGADDERGRDIVSVVTTVEVKTVDDVEFAVAGDPGVLPVPVPPVLKIG